MLGMIGMIGELELDAFGAFGATPNDSSSNQTMTATKTSWPRRSWSRSTATYSERQETAEYASSPAASS